MNPYIPDSGITHYFHGRRSRWCKPTPSFVRSYLTAPVELSNRYTTAEIVLEISVRAQPWQNNSYLHVKNKRVKNVNH